MRLRQAFRAPGASPRPRLSIFIVMGRARSGRTTALLKAETVLAPFSSPYECLTHRQTRLAVQRTLARCCRPRRVVIIVPKCGQSHRCCKSGIDAIDGRSAELLLDSGTKPRWNELVVQDICCRGSQTRQGRIALDACHEQTSLVG